MGDYSLLIIDMTKDLQYFRKRKLQREWVTFLETLRYTDKTIVIKGEPPKEVSKQPVGKTEDGRDIFLLKKSLPWPKKDWGILQRNLNLIYLAFYKVDGFTKSYVR